MNNTFYHFTSRHHVKKCLLEGLKYGSIPDINDNGEVFLTDGYQWLTTSADFNQEWCKESSLPYDRTEYRLTIKIPKLRKNNLFQWLDICKTNKLAKDLNSFGDPENWWLYKGVVMPQWIKKCNSK